MTLSYAGCEGAPVALVNTQLKSVVPNGDTKWRHGKWDFSELIWKLMEIVQSFPLPEFKEACPNSLGERTTAVEEGIIVRLNEWTEVSETNSRLRCYLARTRARTEPKVTSYSKPGRVVNWHSSSVSNMNPSQLLSALLEVTKQEHRTSLSFPPAFHVIRTLLKMHLVRT